MKSETFVPDMTRIENGDTLVMTDIHGSTYTIYADGINYVKYDDGRKLLYLHTNDEIYAVTCYERDYAEALVNIINKARSKDALVLPEEAMEE